MIGLVSCTASLAVAADRVSWPSTLPVYDHIVIVVEENKDFEQIFGGRVDAPYIRKLAAEGATFERRG
jgi:phospholipase C